MSKQNSALSRALSLHNIISSKVQMLILQIPAARWGIRAGIHRLQAKKCSTDVSARRSDDLEKVGSGGQLFFQLRWRWKVMLFPQGTTDDTESMMARSASPRRAGEDCNGSPPPPANTAGTKGNSEI